MDTKGMQGHPEGCRCALCQGQAMGGGMCGHHHGGHLIIKILLAIFIFWCGIQLGELKAMLYHEYPGYGMMGSYGDGNQWYGGPSPTRSGTYGGGAPTATTSHI